MTQTCDTCQSSALEAIYEPEGGGRGLKVYVCNNCGLLQSFPRIDNDQRRPAAVSSGADWGNVRYGKGFRTQVCLEALSKHADLTDAARVLDVGSNRGSFVRALLALAPRVQIVAVEPDERVVDSCAGLERVETIHARIENTALPDASFDIIHSCHTIEHLGYPLSVLEDHHRLLKPGGLLLVDAPNVELIGGADILEEWFIDKHLYHYSPGTLAAVIKAAGFEIVQAPDARDRENVLILARKRGAAGAAPSDAAQAAHARDLVARYRKTRQINRAALREVAAELTRLSSKKVLVWGAGRLFDSLVLHGGFDPKTLAALVDTHLIKHMKERHGMALQGEDALEKLCPGVIVVMSRAFAGEISTIARARAPNAEILVYTDLLSSARGRTAGT
ncbi:MAG TPA: class I SAM-dependent methyltransferase [Rhizomicrobium sp.]|nr:class I SAM-dependent methyltransferase [Rhizomicrobium sp.]